MLEGPALIVILIGAILSIILLVAVLKIHPFLVLLMASFGIGMAVGMPLQDIITSINQGFGGLMAYVGLVIVFGAIIGTILEKSGGAVRIADMILRLVGPKRPALAMSLIGAIVSVPVFCDSGFVILSRLNKAIALRARVPLATLTVALASGLYATHTLVPPTPGPIAAAGNIGVSDYLGTVIGIGLLTAVPVIAIGYLWALYIGRSIRVEREKEPLEIPEDTRNSEALPSAALSFAPIILPIMLIASASIIKVGQWTGGFADGILFVGHPLVALFIGVCVSLALLPSLRGEYLHTWIGKGILQAGPILLITGAGGALGSVLQATPIPEFISRLAVQSMVTASVFLLIIFCIAAAIKSTQGSSTAAMVITSSVVAPLLPALNIHTPTALALVVMAIGSGAMAVSHVNDSYFWIVAQFSGLKAGQALRSLTIVTLLQGLTGLAITLILFQIIV